VRLVWLLLAVWLSACAEEQPSSRQVVTQPPSWESLWEENVLIDTVGVRNVAEGDTSSGHPGLCIIETTMKFPPPAEGGEVFAWEFYARELRPVKLIIVRFDESGEHFELVGESETVVPRERGVNRFALREPIPVGFRYMFGIVQPEKPAVPFRKVHNWKTLITTRPLERPLMRRDYFATYGWRYSVRVFWRAAGGQHR